MKRFRGRKRYYKTIEKRINEFEPHWDTDSWYSMWHWHFDNRGRSETIKERRIHLKYYLKLLDGIRGSKIIRMKDFQTWIFIDHDAPTCDALFIHTENPYTEFHINYSQLNWIQEVPTWMRGLINSDEYKIGKGIREEDGSIFYIIYKPGLGVPLST